MGGRRSASTLVDRDRRDAARTAPRDRASRSPLAFWSVATVFLVVMTGTTLPSPLFGIYEQRLHISSLSVTVIYGIYSIGVVGALAVLARFGSGIGLRTRLAAGLALSAVSAAVFLVTTSLGLLIAARVLSGLAAGLTSGTATSAMIGLGGTDRRARSAAIAVGVSFGGLAVGSASRSASTSRSAATRSTARSPCTRPPKPRSRRGSLPRSRAAATTARWPTARASRCGPTSRCGAGNGG